MESDNYCRQWVFIRTITNDILSDIKITGRNEKGRLRKEKIHTDYFDPIYKLLDNVICVLVNS